MMKITDLSQHSKLENSHNQWLTKYFLAPLYMKPLSRNIVMLTSTQAYR